jgi:hypothetical protein
MRYPVRYFRNEAGEVAAIAAEAADEAAGIPSLSVVDEVTEGFGEGLVGDGEVLIAAAGEHQGPLGLDGPGQLDRQSGLAHSRLSPEEGHRPLPSGSLLPQPSQTLELVVAPDERPWVDPVEQWRQGHGRPERRSQTTS